MKNQLIVLCTALALAATGCKSETNRNSASRSGENDSIAAIAKRKATSFLADSAYRYISEQVAFGPRVTGSEGNRQCREYIIEKLKGFGVDTVTTQKFLARTFDGKSLDAANIFARIAPDNHDRVLLVAHYDTRPWADNDPTTANRTTPIDGANDGASGVGVILELCRQFVAEPPRVGVDILFVDAEDYGNSDGWELHNDTWCLGSQYFADNLPYKPGEFPHYGIVLDMVGGIDARFHREYFSEKYAPLIVNRVWRNASVLGYGNMFIDQIGGSLIDDHIPLSKAGIPTIDIVECNNALTGGFPPTWHTIEDNLDNISKATLKAVGQVVEKVVRGEVPAELIKESKTQCHDY